MEQKKEEVKKTSTEKKDGLRPVKEFFEILKLETWQEKAFIQFSGWIDGKSVTRKEFDIKYAWFIKKYMGGK